VQGPPGKKLTRPPSQPIAGHRDTHLPFQATWETEIIRIMDPDQLQLKKKKRSLFHLNGKKAGCGRTPIIPALAGGIK
jgi:hypothetical protein